MNYKTFDIIDTIDTYPNTTGIIALSSSINIAVLAYPEESAGYVRTKFYEKKISTLINCHDNPIACLGINSKGTLLSTASTRGTLIRIFNSEDGFLLQTVRRGISKTNIYHLKFDASDKFLMTCSNKGTLHIFSLRTAFLNLKEKQFNE